MTCRLFGALVLVCLCSQPLAAQSPDTLLGMGIVHLAVGDELRAVEALQRIPGSANARAIMERLDRSQPPYRHAFELDDPVLRAFESYIREGARRGRYPFFAELRAGLDREDTNGDLGDLGLFRGAEFSPGCTWLVVHGTSKTLVLESATGAVVQRIERSILGDPGQPRVMEVQLAFTKDETHLLRTYKESTVPEGQRATSRDDARYVISYETWPQGKVLWTHTAPPPARSAFSADGSRVVVLDATWPEQRRVGDQYQLLQNLTVTELDRDTGTPLATRQYADITEEKLDALCMEASAPPLRGKGPWGESADGRYTMHIDGYATTFTLYRNEDGRLLRKLLFVSDVE